MLRALVSVHDVMPANLARVEQLLATIARQGMTKLTLLVVPGVPWSSADVDRLRRWQDQGYQLAGHGWTHHCSRIRGWRHRLHSWLISRDVAEHLATSSAGCMEIMQRCAEWFDDHGMAIPALYVPPAWALGPVSGKMLERLPFSLLETQTGLLHTRTGHRYRLPLVGFEADTAFRSRGLRCFNAANWALARLLDRPLRIALHPRDLELRLRGDVLRATGRSARAMDYTDLCRNPNVARCLCGTGW